MSRILSLIKTDLNTTFGLSALQYKIKNKQNRGRLLSLELHLLSLIPYYLIISGLSNIYDILFRYRTKIHVSIKWHIFNQLIVFFFGILYVMSKYYFSNDLNILVPLPLSPKEIVGAKFVSSNGQ